MVKCVESGIWPGTPDEWEKVEIPSDAMVADLEESTDE